MGYVQTVLGPIDPAQMGITTTHEHLLWDQSCYADMQINTFPHTEENEYLWQAVNAADRGRILYHLHAHRDNIYQQDGKIAAQEASEFKKYGGQTLVDCTCYGLSPAPLTIRQIAIDSGLNVIAPTGIYIKESHPAWVKDAQVDDIADLFLRELTQGIGDTGIKAGYIGEIGMSSFCCEERKVMEAAAIAQRESGACVILHTNFEYASDALDIFKRHSADLTKVILGHNDCNWNHPERVISLLDRGANVAFDTFGLCIALQYSFFFPSDFNRIDGVHHLVDAGYGKQIVFGQDTCFKIQWKRNGGFGYSNIVEHILPCMINSGFSAKEVDDIYQNNPRRLFTIEQ